MSPQSFPPIGRAPDRAVSLAEAVLRGWIDALTMPGVVLLQWLVNVVCAAAAVWPIAALVQDHLAHSAVAEDAFTDVGMDTLVEFLTARAAELDVAVLAVIAFAGVYLLVNLYLAGGVLDRVVNEARRPWAWFFAACQRHFWPLVRAGLFVLALFAGAVMLPYEAIEWVIQRLTKDAATPHLEFYLRWAHWAIMFFLWSWLARVYDYARLTLVADPNQGAVFSCVRSMGFTLRHGWRTLVLWLVLSAVAPACIWAALRLSHAVGLETAPAMWINLAIGQVCVLVRIAGGIARFSGQWRLLRTMP